jgi:hypothetical protein
MSADNVAKFRQFYLRIRQQPEQARLSTGNERGMLEVRAHLPNDLKLTQEYVPSTRATSH